MDTSALLSVLDADDRFHPLATEMWQRLLGENAVLITSNYALLEVTALVRHRMGMEAVSLL